MISGINVMIQLNTWTLNFNIKRQCCLTFPTPLIIIIKLAPLPLFSKRCRIRQMQICNPYVNLVMM